MSHLGKVHPWNLAVSDPDGLWWLVELGFSELRTETVREGVFDGVFVTGHQSGT